MLDKNEFVKFFSKSFKLGLEEQSNYYLADSYLKRGEFDKALNSLKVFARVFDVSPLTNILLSRIFVNLNKTARSQFQVGESLIKQKRYKEALSYFNQVMNSTSEENIYQIAESKALNIKAQLEIYKEIN